MNEPRCLRLIKNAILILDLDLTGLVVLTEAASGYYMLTPLIAALANAKHVYALTRDSHYGKAAAVETQTMALAQRWGVADRITVLFSREDERISEADIVTNLGFVRPIDACLLGRLKRTVVIPLMFETWEYRPQDLDLGECRQRGVPVLGTNEHHPKLQILRYVGHLSLKLLFDLDIEIFRSQIMVIGDGEFGNQVVQSLEDAGATILRLAPERESLCSGKAQEFLTTCDALVLTEHRICKTIVGQGGIITASELTSLNPGLALVHIAGGVDQEDLESSGITFRPSLLAKPGYMSVTTDYMGPKPLIDLHAAGLKVGQAMAQAVSEGLTGTEAERRAMELCDVAQEFGKLQQRV